MFCYLTASNDITYLAEALPLGKADVRELAPFSCRQLQRGTAWGWSGLATSLWSHGKRIQAGVRAARLLASLQVKGRECLHSAAPWTALLVISTMTALKKKSDNNSSKVFTIPSTFKLPRNRKLPFAKLSPI